MPHRTDRQPTKLTDRQANSTRHMNNYNMIFTVVYARSWCGDSCRWAQYLKSRLGGRRIHSANIRCNQILIIRFHIFMWLQLEWNFHCADTRRRLSHSCMRTNCLAIEWNALFPGKHEIRNCICNYYAKSVHPVSRLIVTCMAVGSRHVCIFCVRDLCKANRDHGLCNARLGSFIVITAIKTETQLHLEKWTI